MTTYADLVGGLPLQLAPMGGGIATPALVGAVRACGATGMAAATALPAPALAALLEAMGDEGPGPLGVNILVPVLHSTDVVREAARRARYVDLYHADPDAELVRLVHAAGAVAGWQVGSVAEARAAVAAGVDVVVVQGEEAGGRLRGSAPLDELLPRVRDAVPDRVPLVAAGGLVDSSDVARALAHGAAAVRAGTAFLACPEAGVHPDYRAAVLAETETVATEEYAQGWPVPERRARVLRCSVEAARAWERPTTATLRVAGREVALPLWAPVPPTADVHGDVSALPMYAGAGVARVTASRPAAEVAAGLLAGLVAA